MSRLIDTTEMYLRTILELEEEGVAPLRARIAERMQHSGPTVSQTAARMERDGLLHVAADRHLELTTQGRQIAIRVMRKHRLAECLLIDVIGLQWEHAHTEACRWEHVMSEAVERRILHLLDHPTHSPYGNPIPGLEELGGKPAVHPFSDGSMASLNSLQPGPDGASAVVRRISEPLQADPELLHTLRHAGVQPGAVISVTPSPAGVIVTSNGQATELPTQTAAHVLVAKC